MRSAGASLIQVAVLLALHCVRGGKYPLPSYPAVWTWVRAKTVR